jgi:glycosyltransferase involved in cell wall biosynthesis
VCYLRPTVAAPLQIAREIARARPDVIYVNSFFDAAWCLSPLALNRLNPTGSTPIVIAPRGQFAPGALQFNRSLKKLYSAAFRSLGLARRVIWQVTSEHERDDVCRVVGPAATVLIAPNVSNVRPEVGNRAPKQAGRLNLVFFSRVSPKKNLAGALDMLATITGNVNLDIAGPVADQTYELCCRRQISKFPANISARWCGPVEPHRVAETLSRYDAMLLPTFGENFGHAIVESLAAGCPVVISNRTPWRNLEAQGAGWDLRLESPDAFRHALDALCRMDEPEHRRLREGALKFAASATRTADNIAAHRRLFELALEMGGRGLDQGMRRAA